MPVEIVCQQGDVGAIKSDVLLLKYAQSFYSADGEIAEVLEKHGLCTMQAMRVPPGDFRVVPTRGSSLAPAQVVFLGTPRLGRFRYPEMETFAADAIQCLANGSILARTLSTTVHGGGYGLDVVEAFQSLVRGFERGLQRTPIPSLERIIFVEHNARRAQVLATALASLPATTIAAGAGPRKMPVNLTTPAKKKVFVAMSFDEEFSDVYQFGIYEVVRQCGYVCERVDEKAIAGNIVDEIREGIQSAEFVIADLSGEKPNVYLEVGYAWGLQRPVLLLARDGTRLHFDLSHHKCIFYKTIGKLAAELDKSIRKLDGQVP